MPHIDFAEMSHRANEVHRRELIREHRRKFGQPPGPPFTLGERMFLVDGSSPGPVFEESFSDIVREQRRQYPSEWRKFWNWLLRRPDYALIERLERELGLEE